MCFMKSQNFLSIMRLFKNKNKNGERNLQSIFGGVIAWWNILFEIKKEEENPEATSFYTYYKPQHKKIQDYGCDDDDDDAKRPW